MSPIVPPLARLVLSAFLFALAASTAHAADLSRRELDHDLNRGAGWRHAASGLLVERQCTLEDITPAYGPIVPTNSLCDPTYVGSAAGLSRPSYDGTLQPPAFRALVSPFPQQP